MNPRRPEMADIVRTHHNEFLARWNPVLSREQRKALSLTQEQLAVRLGVAQETLSRWETGAQIQQRSLDNLLRLFFLLPTVRNTLTSLTGAGQEKHKSDQVEGLRMATVLVVPETDDFRLDVSHSDVVWINGALGVPHLKERNARYVAPCWKGRSSRRGV